LEYVSLRQTYQQTCSDIDSANKKNADMSAELLSLVNAQTIMEASHARLTLTTEQDRKLRDEHVAWRRNAEEVERKLSSDVLRLTGEVERMKLECIKKEVELSRAAADFEVSTLIANICDLL
jgi:DNA polymerase III alpha subunit